MNQKDAWKALVDAVFANTSGKTFGWHGEQVQGNLDGLQEDSVENQFSFLVSMACRGTDRVIAEQISASAVKTLDQAQERASYAYLLDYEPGTRVGVARLTSAEDCSKNEVMRALMADSEKAKQRREEYGLGLKTDKNGKTIGLTGTESDEFQAYLADTAGKEPFLTMGIKEWEKRQAEKEAKTAKKAAQAGL